MATIGDVAKAAGVSRSTASYAMSGKRPVSPATRERVAEVVSALGFTPNAGARALATSQTHVLGLLVQFHEDEFAPAMLQYILGISETARGLGYDILMVTEEDGAGALRRITKSNMVDAVVLLDVTDEDPRLDDLRSAEKPGALVGLPGDCAGLDVFDLDFAEAGRALIDHLCGLGHRELILVSPPAHVFERGGAYAWRFRDAAVERARAYGARIHAECGESRPPAISASLNRVLDRYPEATGMVVHNDASVVALRSVLFERGVRVPSDLSVVSLYSSDFGRDFSVPFTAIESAPDRLGRMAVQQLVRRIESPKLDEPYVTRFISPELLDRGSTAAPSSAPNSDR
jgi:DNA-binding LacI/PurR family transcriptional regulator